MEKKEALLDSLWISDIGPAPQERSSFSCRFVVFALLFDGQRSICVRGATEYTALCAAVVK